MYSTDKTFARRWSRRSLTYPLVCASLLLLIEPVLNPIWTWLVRGEDPGTQTLVGGAIIVTATVTKGLYDARAPAIVTKSTRGSSRSD